MRENKFLFNPGVAVLSRFFLLLALRGVFLDFLLTLFCRTFFDFFVVFATFFRVRILF